MLEKFPEAELLGQEINCLYIKYLPLDFFFPQKLYLGSVSGGTLGTPQKAGLEFHVYYKLILSLQVAHTLRSEHGERHSPKISPEQPCVQIGPSWRKAFEHTADTSRHQAKRRSLDSQEMNSNGIRSAGSLKFTLKTEHGP